MMDNGGLSVADALALSRDNGSNNDGFFGGDGSWIFFLFFLLAWGGNWGNGVFGGAGSAGGSELQRGFDNQTVMNKLNGLENGLCDGFYAMNTGVLNGFAGVQQTLCQGFNGVNTGILQSTNAIQQGMNAINVANMQSANALSSQLADCCCGTQRAIDGVNYNMAKGFCDLGNVVNNTTRDILENNNNNTRQILDFMINTRLSDLQAENQNLKLKASQEEQNNYLVSQLKPCPIPAYITCNPYESAYGFRGYNNCGCGC